MLDQTLRCWWVNISKDDATKITIKFMVEIPEEYSIVSQNTSNLGEHNWAIDGNAIPVYKIIAGKQPLSGRLSFPTIEAKVKLSKDWSEYNNHKSGIRIINVNEPDDEETMSTSGADIDFIG